MIVSKMQQSWVVESKVQRQKVDMGNEKDF